MIRYRLQTYVAVVLGTLALIFAQWRPADAITAQSVVPNVHYVCAFAPVFSNSYPYSGALVLTYNHGILSGTYRDLSIKPGSPFRYGTIQQVSGGVSGDSIHFQIGAGFSFNGKLQGDIIDGSATARGRIYQFYAKQGTLKH
jgi:hypothetical protein